MGLGVWIALPLLLFVVFLTATGFDALNLDKLNKFGRELRSIFQFRFLDNFHVVYDQLKELEALSPHPSGRHNFAEIARDFMPVIYLIGLLQGFIKVMFPLFVLPLFWSLRSSLNRSRLLVLALVFSYLFMVYLSLITKDYFQGRFLLTPVFLLYPWVGAGMDRLYVLLKRSSRAPLYLFLFAAFVFVPPIFKCAKLVWTQDDVIIRAGNWLSEKKAFASASIISTDSRVPFYAGRGKDFLHYRRKLYDQRYDALERIAQANGMEVIVARTSKKDRKSIPKMQNYRKVKEFTGKRDVVIFYAKPEG